MHWGKCLLLFYVEDNNVYPGQTTPVYLQKTNRNAKWDKAINPFSPGDNLRRLLQKKYTQIRQLPMSDHGVLYLFMCDTIRDIFLCVSTKNMQF